jgi:hypothetical protein
VAKKEEKHTDESMRDTIIQVGGMAANRLKDHFSGGTKVDEGLDDIFKAVMLGVRVSHMNQHGDLVTRGQAIRLLQWLPDEAARAEYIKLTNPVAAPLLER